MLPASRNAEPARRERTTKRSSGWTLPPTTPSEERLSEPRHGASDQGLDAGSALAREPGTVGEREQVEDESWLPLRREPRQPSDECGLERASGCRAMEKRSSVSARRGQRRAR